MHHDADFHSLERMQRSLPVMEQRGFGETLRRDPWWLQNIAVVVVFTSFLVYGTWAAFQNANYVSGPYLSPFYSPEIFGSSPHAIFGPQPAWWPAWLPFSPALIILPFPGLFRFTCYYYRGAYYKAFWADPPGCAVGEPRKSYLGERSFPLILQNVHRYFFIAATIILIVLWYQGTQYLIERDPDLEGQSFGLMDYLSSVQRGHAPGWELLSSVGRFLMPDFHPVHEGRPDLADAFMAQAPAR